MQRYHPGASSVPATPGHPEPAVSCECVLSVSIRGLTGHAHLAAHLPFIPSSIRAPDGLLWQLLCGSNRDELQEISPLPDGRVVCLPCGRNSGRCLTRLRGITHLFMQSNASPAPDRLRSLPTTRDTLPIPPRPPTHRIEPCAIGEMHRNGPLARVPRDARAEPAHGLVPRPRPSKPRT